LIRRAATKYGDPQFRTLSAKVPSDDAADRSNLIRPGPSAPPA